VAAFCDRLVSLNRALSCLASHGLQDWQSRHSNTLDV
jgi:hypothetical protein